MSDTPTQILIVVVLICALTVNWDLFWIRSLLLFTLGWVAAEIVELGR